MELKGDVLARRRGERRRMSSKLAWLVLYIVLSLQPAGYAQFSPGKECFCPVGDAVDSCECAAANSIDKFNNKKVYPLLKKLLDRDFFKFYKVPRVRF